MSGSAFASSSLRHRHAHELAPCRGQRRDLRRRRLDVVRLRQRHRLHDDGRATPDRDTADRDLPLAWHRAFRVPGAAGCARARAARLPSDPVAPRAAARRPPERPLGRGCRPRARDAARGIRPRPLPHAVRRLDRLVLTRPPSGRPARRLRPSRSLRRAARRYEIRVDTAFGEVIRGCARPGDPASWIDAAIVAAYETLHRLGWAHSVEAHDDEGLAGGLYGVALGGLFAAESMFSRRTDASKAAFVALVERLRSRGTPEQRVLDVQWLTPHLASLGAVELERREYRRGLAPRCAAAVAFV